MLEVTEAASCWNPNAKYQGRVSRPSAPCSGGHILCAEDQQCTIGQRRSSRVAGVFAVQMVPFPGPLGKTPSCGLVELRMFDRYQMQGHRAAHLSAQKRSSKTVVPEALSPFPLQGALSPSSELWLRGPSK